MHMRDYGVLAQDISILHRSYYKDTSSAFKDLDLNPTAACILLAVHDAAGINQQRISEYLAIDKALTAREVAKLERAGYVRRLAVRGKSISLETKKSGEGIIERVSRIRSQWWRDRFAQSGVSEHSGMLEGIERVVSTLTGSLSERPGRDVAQTDQEAEDAGTGSGQVDATTIRLVARNPKATAISGTARQTKA